MKNGDLKKKENLQKMRSFLIALSFWHTLSPPITVYTEFGYFQDVFILKQKTKTREDILSLVVKRI